MKCLSASAAVNKVTVVMSDTATTSMTLTGGTDLVTAADTWENKSITFVEGTYTFDPADSIAIILRLFSTNSGETSIESVKLNWRLR